MSFNGFPPEGLVFLNHLDANNAKPCFEAHRSEYENYLLAPAKALVVTLGKRLVSGIPASNTIPVRPAAAH